MVAASGPVAYIIRRTFSNGRSHEDAQTIPVEPVFLSGEQPCTQSYTRALEAVDRVRAEATTGTG